ncbi:UNVERIFIED_CONTAM: hypothetical protein BJ099_109164 [Lysinibacillus xylanilyticus]
MRSSRGLGTDEKRVFRIEFIGSEAGDKTIQKPQRPQDVIF